MNTPDSNPLFERIAEAAYRSLSLPAEVGMKRDYETTWAWTERMGRAQADQIAAAVLPIVAVEVRKAKAEALREAARGFFAMSPHITYSGQHVQERLLSRADRYETGDSDEHR